ncbi:MAG: integrase core domain-containing protein [Nitrospirota bacterium]
MTLHRRWLLGAAVRLWQLLQRWLARLLAKPRWRRTKLAKAPRRFRAHPKPKWVREEIIRLKALMPEAGCRTIAHCFNRRWAGRRRMTVGKTYVADTILRARRKLKHRLPRPIPRHLIWRMDLLTTTDGHGRQHIVLAILDHASRACLCVQRLTEKSSLTIWHHLIAVCRQYGLPRFLRTDNEAVFTSQRLRLALRLLGIRLQHNEPGCPWQNGRVERLIGTVKRLLLQQPIEDAASLDRALAYTRSVYNHLRPHQHLHGQTPAEVWAGVDVFIPTPRSRRWLRRWERQWGRAAAEFHRPG